MEAANSEAVNSCHALDVFPNLSIDFSRFFQFGATDFSSVIVYPPSLPSRRCGSVLSA
jgi:hypothetical protein